MIRVGREVEAALEHMKADGWEVDTRSWCNDADALMVVKELTQLRTGPTWRGGQRKEKKEEGARRDEGGGPPAVGLARRRDARRQQRRQQQPARPPIPR